MAGTTYLLDSNMVSYLINARSPVARKRSIDAQESGTLAISSITEGELLFGLRKQPGATRLHQNFDEFRRVVRVFSWDSSVAEAYADLREHLRGTGKNLDVMDLLIASHALAIGATLVTRDKAFAYVAGRLNVVNWAKDLT